MPYAVYKTTGMEAVDAYYSDDLEARLAEAAGLLEGTLLGAVEQFSQEGFMPGDEVENYQSGWPSSEKASKVLQHGYAQAVRIAQERHVPIESFFITGPGDDYEFHICSGRDRVTVFTLVPHSRDYGSKRADTQTWVVRIGDDAAIDGSMPREELDQSGEFPVVMIQTSGVPAGGLP
jgi:hypothetical protein